MRDLSLLAAFRDTPFEIKLYGQHGDGSNGIFFVPTPLDNPIDRATHLSGEIHQSLPFKFPEVSKGSPNSFCKSWDQAISSSASARVNVVHFLLAFHEAAESDW